MWNKLINFLFENLPIISFFMYFTSNHKVGGFIRGISNWRIDEVDRSQLRKMLKITFDRLEVLNKQELVRKEVIESKAKANLTFISLGVTIAFAGTTLLLTALPHDSLFVEYAIVIKALIGISVIYLIQGGIAALLAMSFPYVYMGVVYKDLTKSCTAASSLKIAKDILLNQYTNTQRSNYLDLTQKSIKNGLIVLSILICTMLVVIKPSVNDNNKMTKVHVENLDQTVNAFEKVAEKQENQLQSINKTFNNLVNEISVIESKIEKPNENKVNNSEEK
jgi:hypothetical protein